MTHEAFELTVEQSECIQLEWYEYRFIYRNAITDEERLVSFVLDTDAFAEVDDAKKVARKNAGIKLGIWGEVDSQSRCVNQWGGVVADDLF